MSETRTLSPVQASILFVAQQRAALLAAQSAEAQMALTQAMLLVADGIGVPVVALGELDLTAGTITLREGA